MYRDWCPRARKVRTKDNPRFTEKLLDAYGPEELRSLLRVCTPEQSLLYRFFLASGAREQEVAFATYRDLDFEAKLFHVRAKEDLGWTLKDYEERSVPLPDSMLQELAERRKARREDRFLFRQKKASRTGTFFGLSRRLRFALDLTAGIA